MKNDAKTRLRIIRMVLQLLMAPLATFGAYVLWNMIPDADDYLIFKFAGGVGLIVLVFDIWRDTFNMTKEFKVSIDES